MGLRVDVNSEYVAPVENSYRGSAYAIRINVSCCEPLTVWRTTHRVLLSL